MTLTFENDVEQRTLEVRRLLVTVRDSVTSRYRPVGFLTQEVSGYHFAYLDRELARTDFRPLPGLSRAATAPVRSPQLFPVFSERVMSARRPDRSISLTALGLSDDAAPFEVLTRSHGQRVGDTIELLPAPRLESGDPVSLLFLTHGVRHLEQDSQDRITRLRQGEELRIEPEPDNPANPRAQLVVDGDRIRLGWVPDPLVNLVDDVDGALAVEKANGPEVGFHFRLLVRLSGHVSPGRQVFAGPQWETST